MTRTASTELIRFPTPSGDAQVSALLTMMRRLSAARSLPEITAVLTQAVRGLLQADGATFVLREGDRCVYADEDAISPLWKGRRFPMGACVSGWAMTHREAVAIPDIDQDARVPGDLYRPNFVRSLAMAPVLHEEPIAALGAYWSDARQIGPETLELLQTIANSAALALAYVRLADAGAAAKPGRRPPPRPAPSEPAAAGFGEEPQAAFLRERGSPLGAFRERVRREGVRPNSADAYLLGVVSALAATLVRAALGELGIKALAPFATYYPAVLLTMLLGGARAGLLSAVLGGALAYWAFVQHRFAFTSFVASDVLNLVLYVASAGLMIWMVHRYRSAVLRLKEEDARHLILAREQGHRVKNAVAVVEGIVRHSLREDPTQARMINQRIRAGLAHIEMDDRAPAEPTSVRGLLSAELHPFDLTRFRLEGDDGDLLAPEMRSILGLAAHELATNAVKYGALSEPLGQVTVAWTTSGGRTTVRWNETGGPPITKAPEKRGYGSLLLRRLLEASGGGIAIDFRTTGLSAEIVLPTSPRRRRRS